MNWLDFSLIILAALCTLSGSREGLSRSGFGFLAVLIAFLSAAWLYPGNPVGFLMVFVGLIGAGVVGALLLGKWFKSAGLKWLDSVLGGVFGLINALLLSTFVVMALMAFAPKLPRHYVARSAFAPYALEAACRVAEVVPDEMKSRVEESYQELAELLPPKLKKAVPRLPRKI